MTHALSAPSPIPQLARAAAQTTWETLPETVKDMALDLFTDSLAVIAGGSTHADMQRLAQQIKACSGPSTALVDMRGVGLREALTLNAAATTVLQRQDGYSYAKGHPASQLAPLLLGIAERDGASGPQMLAAFVAGYEVATRVGIALGGVPAWLHDIGNWANIGLAAAAASMAISPPLPTPSPLMPLHPTTTSPPVSAPGRRWRRPSVTANWMIRSYLISPRYHP